MFCFHSCVFVGELLRVLFSFLCCFSVRESKVAKICVCVCHCVCSMCVCVCVCKCMCMHVCVLCVQNGSLVCAKIESLVCALIESLVCAKIESLVCVCVVCWSVCLSVCLCMYSDSMSVCTHIMLGLLWCIINPLLDSQREAGGFF